MNKFTEIKARVEALAGVKHTPGPWAAEPVYRTADGSHYVFSDSDQNCLIAKLPVRESREQTADNARLIAAGPEAVADRAELVAMIEDMAAVLQKLVEVCEPVQPLMQASNVKMVRWAAKFMSTLEAAQAAAKRYQSETPVPMTKIAQAQCDLKGAGRRKALL